MRKQIKRREWQLNNDVLGVIDGNIICDVYVADNPKGRALAGLEVVRFVPRRKSPTGVHYVPESYWQPGGKYVVNTAGMAMQGEQAHSYFVI